MNDNPQSFQMSPEQIANFNHLHSQALSILEKTFSLLTNKFQRLRKIETLPDKIPSVVLASCTLFNFISNQEPFD